jgi:dTDP-4-dehydrorhamnose 3,5-epimerase
VLSDVAEFAYKCDEFYHPEDEGGIPWDDPMIAVDWPKVEGELKLSKKDTERKPLEEDRAIEL